MSETTQAPEPTSYVVEGNSYRGLISERDLMRTEIARLQNHLRQKSEQITRLQDGIERMQQGSSERAATEKEESLRESIDRVRFEIKAEGLPMPTLSDETNAPRACGHDVGFNMRCRRELGHAGPHTWDPKRLCGDDPVNETEESREPVSSIDYWQKRGYVDTKFREGDRVIFNGHIPSVIVEARERQYVIGGGTVAWEHELRAAPSEDVSP